VPAMYPSDANAAHTRLSIPTNRSSSMFKRHDIITDTCGYGMHEFTQFLLSPLSLQHAVEARAERRTLFYGASA